MLFPVNETIKKLRICASIISGCDNCNDNDDSVASDADSFDEIGAAEFSIDLIRKVIAASLHSDDEIVHFVANKA